MIATPPDEIRLAQHTLSRAMQSLAFLRKRLSKYPYIATAPISPDARPEKWFPQDHCSAVLTKGERVWMFSNAHSRDAFVKTVDEAVVLTELPDMTSTATSHGD